MGAAQPDRVPVRDRVRGTRDLAVPLRYVLWDTLDRHSVRADVERADAVVRRARARRDRSRTVPADRDQRVRVACDALVVDGRSRGARTHMARAGRAFGAAI